ncbi:4'-phosphopantetheinyl transferase superfamily protein [Leifsonia shinshuensis]|uniref:4'-phosphopantetheinyl transferase family protein n=1 Tax=Leifsonia shinshuensis TaxID=150026 RepID=UPI001F514E6B|nr:4'-phosphopantetheinyl transferase superfamily protein [Leifsonia shinshuensis]MCI0156130.1 4'-phosphopantetheinyl transferase superfamily protein [Leifsonia shinshuensis]
MDLSVVVVAKTRDVLSVLPGDPLGRAAEARRRALRSPSDREDFVAARLLAVRALQAAGAGDIAPAALHQSCAVCGGAHGRPLPVSGLHVSWSHSRGWVAAGASPAALGVDVEVFADAATGETGVGGLPLEALTPSERSLLATAPDPARAFRLAWAAKEACVKAGVAQLDGLGRVGVLAGPDRLVPSYGALLLSSRAFRGANAAAASAAPVSWHTLGGRGELAHLPGSGRPVGAPA